MIMAVLGAISAGSAKACATMTGTWRARPYPKPAKIWYPTHLTVEVPMSRVCSRPAAIVMITDPAGR